MGGQWIVNLTARRDGSSRFGSNNEFHNFGSAAAAWIFSQTKLLRKMLPLISFGKLSASYGTTGNDQIGDYKYLSVYGATNVPTTYQGVSGLLPTGLSNPYLQWEETRKMRAALNIGLVKDRVLVSAAYFRNRSSNQLLTYALPLITGFTNITRNFPATVQNSGWEFTLNTINFRTRAFNWSSAVNFTIPQNKLVAFSGLANSSYASSLIIGQPVTLLKAYRFLGTNPSTGIFQFADAHGNPTPTPNSTTDQTILENSSPRFYGGIQNSFSYRGLQLDVFVQFVKQTSSNYYGTIGYFPGVFSSSGPIGNQPSFVLARWQKPGDISVIQRFSTQPLQSGNARSSSAAWSDGSYARLKNISLSYQIPDSWKKKVHLQACRIYAQAQNLLTFTKFTGLDPETPSSFTLPPLRVITVGLQIGL